MVTWTSRWCHHRLAFCTPECTQDNAGAQYWCRQSWCTKNWCTIQESLDTTLAQGGTWQRQQGNPGEDRAGAKETDKQQNL